MSHSSDSRARAELELERELRQMFELDSQQDLETYLTCVEHLEDESWTADIQKMYRAVHTIKGGSVTVKADAILNVATVLEDLLSELRYLEAIPSLDDGQLQQMLLEGGEIIASVLSNQEGNVTSKVERIKVLQQQIQASYLQDWNEQTQIQIEFAEQGLDLVVLDLEIALDNLPDREQVPASAIALAEQLIGELAGIGKELKLESGWQTLLQETAQILDESDASLWKTKWRYYFDCLKASAKQGGKLVRQESTEDIAQTADLEAIDSLLQGMDFSETDNADMPREFASKAAEDLADTDSLLNNLGSIDSLLDGFDTFEDNNNKVAEPTKSKTNIPTSSSPPKALDKPVEDIQVPIPLSRLDKSAHSIVDTLIAARSMESFYQDLYQDLIKLINVAKDNVRYITQLRQIQDDYALLENLNQQAPKNAQSPTPERYRQGYTTINRLLENSLRLSELGTEAEQTAKKTSEKLEKLNNHILDLKDIVEDSRLVPFKSLAFRVRAILRDLINRYDKSVQLVVKGEEIELDVGTSRRLEPILLHLVRNAFDHGLESREARIARGKSEPGTLQLSLQRYGSSYVLSLEDDGRGIDRHKIEAKAQQLNFSRSDTSTPEQLLAVICQPGFSSQSKVSEVSGRGVGMDVVAEQISLLDGSLSLNTTLGMGTTFKINFPVPHLLVSCLLLQAGDRNFAIPTDRVVTTELWENLAAIKTDKPQVRYTWEISRGGETFPGLDLFNYWYPQRDRTLDSSSVGVYIRLEAEQSGIWLLADKLLGKLELRIQPLPQPLVVPQGIMGVSLQADSSLIPVLELSSLIKYLVPETQVTAVPISPIDSPIDLFSSMTDSQERLLHLSASPELSQTILIVDDAALIRRRIEASLSAYGYTTHACADGLEAWNWLQNNSLPKLMITDIEMPNLDGFSLINRCRQNNWDFPILVVSSRLAEEWGQEARRLGGTDFLTKGFSTGELIDKVQEYYL